MLKIHSLVLLVVLLFTQSFAFAANDDDVVAPEVKVKAKKIRAYDEVSYTPHSVVIDQPASDIYLGETLVKLPGVLVRNVSGFGSATTVITSEALGSGSTAVSIDDIPVLDTSGRGANFSLFPSTLISSVEYHSPFYPTLNPESQTLPTPGGRINLNTLSPPRAGELPWVGSLMLGSGKSIQATGGYRGGDDRRDWAVALNGYNTAGDYHYHDPLTDEGKDRTNNDAWATSALAKYHFKLRNSGSVEMVDFFSTGDRTNTGSIYQPTREHQKDMYNMLGVKYQDPKAISQTDGLFAKMAGAYQRTATRTAPTAGFSDSTDSRSWGHYSQFGYTRKVDTVGVTMAVDNQFDYLRDDSGIYNRNNLGITGILDLDMANGLVKVIPMGRKDESTKFSGVGDGAVSVMVLPDSTQDLTLSYGLTHLYPTITATTGFRNSGVIFLPATDLKVQRDSILSATYNKRHNKYSLNITGFYDLVQDRVSVTFIPGPGATFKFVNAAEVAVWGTSFDVQVFPVDPFALRTTLTLQRAWDRSTGHEMTFKPRYEGFVSASYNFLPWLAFTAQEQIEGKRFTSTTSVDTLSPFWQTHLRVDAKLWQGIAFFKVSNLLDTGAFDNFPGFPAPGRSYWLGYTLGRGEFLN